MSDVNADFTAVRKDLLSRYSDLQSQAKFPKQINRFYLILTAIFILSLAGIAATNFTPFLWLRALVLGALYSSLGLMTHELLHGSIIPVEKARGLAWLGFFVFGLSPELWMTWHNRVHHFHTNQSGQDPDSFGLWDDFRKLPMSETILKRAPGSRTFWSYLHFPITFSNQVASVMWFFLWKGDAKLYSTANRKRAVFETLAMYGIWILFFIGFGWVSGVMTLLIPALIANLVVSSYIMVQHLFCPLSDHNDPLETTLSVTTLPILDRMHVNFGHHVEHHLFPEMNHSLLPRVREILLNDYSDRYRVMSHAQAIKTLLTTPRVYQSKKILWDPIAQTTLDVSQIGRPTKRNSL